MSRFLNQLHNGLNRCSLNDAKTLLAVSGGADSTAMLRGFVHWQAQRRLTLIVAHLNHHLRGAESQADAAWVTALCGELGVPIVVGEERVAERASQWRLGVEEAARKLRYAFLLDTARRQECTHIVLAHTADDQAETILHHILRGTGLQGLRGMPAARTLAPEILLVRPLLDIGRRDVEEYLGELKQDSRRDPTNLDASYTRNRIRHRLLPILEQQYNPQVREALRRLGRQAAEAEDAFEQLSGRLLRQAVVEQRDDYCRLDCEVLRNEPRHLIRVCFTQLWRELNWPRRRMGFDEWDRLAELALSGGAAVLPGNITARCSNGLLVLSRSSV